MRKVKVGLLLLFCMLLSLCLFACAPGDTGGGASDEVRSAKFLSDKNRITLTDYETADEARRTEAFGNAVKALTINVETVSGKRERIKGDACDYEMAGMDWGMIGTQQMTAVPKASDTFKNTNKVAVDLPLEVRITHDFQNGICRGCGAVESAQALEEGKGEAVRYGMFHAGVVNDTENGDLTALTAFGNVDARVSGQTVSTPVGSMTVGRLRKGMSVTVTGTAQHVPLEDIPTADRDKQWYFPNIGIALREFDARTSPVHPSDTYDGGMSVIVRNDSFVLMNGIGNPDRLLAGLVGGATEEFNYGSHRDADEEDFKNTTYWEHYDPRAMPADTSSWENWAVYSTGTIMRTGDYDDESSIRLTWTFRTDNVVELVYEHADSGVLTAWIRIPDEYADAQFDTVLHGDYMNMTFTSVSIAETEQLQSATFKGLDAEDRYYAANEAFDFASMKDKVMISFGGAEQPHNDFTLQVKRDEAWVTLKEGDVLLADDTDFKIVVSIGSVTKEIALAVGDEKFIAAIVKNNIVSADGFRFNNGGATFDGTAFGSIAFTGNAQDQIVLQPAGNAAALPADFTAAGTALEGCTGYVALRIWAADGQTFGTAAAASSPVVFVTNNGDALDIIVGVGKEGMSEVAITGAQEKAIVIDLAQVSVPAMTAQFAIEGGRESIPVNTGADVTVTLTVSDAAYASASIDLTVSGWMAKPVSGLQQGAKGSLMSDSGAEYAYTVDSVKEQGGVHTIVLTITIPALTGIPKEGRIPFYYKASDNAVVNYLYYGAPTGDGVQKIGNTYFYADGTDLYFYTASVYDDAVLTADNLAADLWLNVNGGEAGLENGAAPAFVNVGFRYENGAIVAADKNVFDEFSAALYGTVGNDRDYDAGYFVAGVVDTRDYGVQAGSAAYSYYFQLGKQADSATMYKVVCPSAAAEQTTIGQVDDFSTDALNVYVLKAGTCIQTGVYAYEYVADDEVVFYASVYDAGGEHSAGNSDHAVTCEYCGGTILRADEESADKKWKNFTLSENEFVEVRESFSQVYTDNAPLVLNGVSTVVSLPDGSGWWVRQDGFIGYDAADADEAHYANKVATNLIAHTLEGEENDPDLRTPLGKPDPDGNEITEEAYIAFMRTLPQLRIRLAYLNEQLWITYSLFAKGADLGKQAPYFTYSAALPVSGTLNIRFMSDPNMIFGKNTNGKNVWQTTGAVVNNHLEGIAAAGDAIVVGTANFIPTQNLTASVGDDVTAISDGIATGYAQLALAGVGSKFADDAEGTAQKTALGIPAQEHAAYTRYVAFTVNFDAPCAPEEAVAMARLAGEYGYAEFNADRTAVSVVIALKSETRTAEMNFFYDNAYTLQTLGVKFDLSAVSLYDVTTNVSNGATFTKGGEVKITYSDQGGDTIINTIWINGIQVPVGESDLVVDGVTFKGLSGKTVTLEIPSFREAPKAYVVETRDENGVLINSTTISAANKSSDANAADIEGGQVVAIGGKLIFIFEGLAVGSTENLFLNANDSSEDVAYGWKDYSFTLRSGSAGKFVSASDGEIVVCTVAGKTYTIVTVDTGLTSAYGFEFNKTGVAAAEGGIAYFIVTVADETALTKGEIADVSQGATEFVAHTETTVGYKGIAVAAADESVVFYANLAVVPTHNWQAGDVAGSYVCETCGAILQSGAANGVELAAEQFGSGKIDPQSGITVSFFLQSANSDFDAVAMRSKWGNINVSLPSLQLNVANSVNLNSDPATKALLDKFWFTNDNGVRELANAFPSTSGAQPASGFQWDTIKTTPNVYMTITMGADGIVYYMNGNKVLTYPADMRFEGNVQGTVKDFVDLIMLSAAKEGMAFNVTQYSGQMSTEDLIIQNDVLDASEAAARYRAYLLENAYYPAAPAAPTHPAWDADGAFTASNPSGFTQYVKRFGISQGETVVLSGTLEANAVPTQNASGGYDSNNWRGFVVPVWSGMNYCGLLRPDDYVYEDAFTANSLSCAHSGSVEKQDQSEVFTGDNAYWASVRKIFQDCTATLTVDYTDSASIVITLKYVATQSENQYANTYTQTYTITGVNGTTDYTFGVGADNATWNVTSFTRT